MDFSALIKQDRFFAKKGMAMAQGMLLAVATAATAACSTQNQRYRAGLVESPLSPRCGEEGEDHKARTCSANAVEIFDKTQHVVQRNTQDTLACFWLRWLAPCSL